MRRDPELCRAILLAIENDQHTEGAGYDEEMVWQHLRLLSDAGYVEIFDFGNLRNADECSPKNLTYLGHDFLDAHVTKEYGKGR